MAKKSYTGSKVAVFGLAAATTIFGTIWFGANTSTSTTSATTATTSSAPLASNPVTTTSSVTTSGTGTTRQTAPVTRVKSRGS